MQSKFRQCRGFSILELLGVVLILGIIATSVLPRFTHSGDTARERVDARNRSTINHAVERYAIENDKLPDTIDDINITEYFPDGLPTNPVTGNAYALDPVTKRAIDGGGT